MPDPRPESPRSPGPPPAERPAPERPPGGRGEEPPPWPRVEPSTDGRGKPPERRPMIPRQGRRAIVAIFVSLLALNVVFALVTGRPEQSTRVPYSPFFLDQVQKGNVSEIASEAETIDGRLKKPVDYKPQGEDKAQKVDRFKTQVPTFVNTDQLTSELQAKGVVLNARPPDSGRNPFLTFVLAFGPTILIFGLLIWLMRRARRALPVRAGWKASRARARAAPRAARCA